MFRSRSRKVFRDVWARKGRTAMASAAIFVGVLGVVTLTSMGDLLLTQLKGDIKEEELPMQAIFVSAPSGTQVDNVSFLDALEDFPGVTRVVGPRRTAVVMEAAEQNRISGWLHPCRLGAVRSDHPTADAHYGAGSLPNHWPERDRRRKANGRQTRVERRRPDLVACPGR